MHLSLWNEKNTGKKKFCDSIGMAIMAALKSHVSSRKVCGGLEIEGNGAGAAFRKTAW